MRTVSSNGSFLLLGFVLLSGLVVPSSRADESSKNETHRRHVTALLTTVPGDPLGSGVVVGYRAGGYLLATSQHVVEGLQRVCVSRFDVKTTAAQVLRPKGRSQQPKSLDLALLWQPDSPDSAKKGKKPILANVEGPLPSAATFPVITTSGFPTPSHTSLPEPQYTEANGLLLPLLTRPLQGGFDLTSTAAVRKGMSGGGVFLDARLIGINGTHADPLWPGALLDASGQPVDALLNQKLELVSLGLSVSNVRQALKAAELPNPNERKGLASLSCGSRSPAQPPTR
jgi:hypothetical protein